MTAIEDQYCTEPLQQIEFKGVHLIEASAGTGKTWTLSALMVRALLEQYLPKQLVATTFTRAASAELKSRIRQRLQDLKPEIEQAVQQSSEHNFDIEKLSDPLLKLLLQRSTDWWYLQQRLALVLQQLDELFVGTLDGFTQRLLTEFGFQSGQTKRLQIAEQPEQYTQQLVQDLLRQWLAKQPQFVVDYLVWTQLLKSADNYLKLISRALNFSNATLAELDSPVIDDQPLQRSLLQLKSAALNDRSHLFMVMQQNAEGKQHPFINGSSWRNDRLAQAAAALDHWLDKVESLGIQYLLLQRKDRIQIDILKAFSSDKIFNKKVEPDIANAWFEHPLRLAIAEVSTALNQLIDQLKNTETLMRQYLLKEVRQQLPQRLIQQNETTFSQQISALNQAIHSTLGDDLATQIHHRYPMILIDEFQDTNQEQDDFLATVWRNDTPLSQGCMIMVGDPKQAIYGFRGGDILTYQQAKNDVIAKQGNLYQLPINYRTVPSLVAAVDALFLRQPDFGEGVIYSAVQAHSAQHSELIQPNSEQQAALQLLQFDGVEQLPYVAKMITELLIQSQQGLLFIEDEQQRQPILARDIAVLSSEHKLLAEMAKTLDQHQVPTVYQSRQSVFNTRIAHDLAAVIAAMLNPFNLALLRRALLARILGFKWSEISPADELTNNQIILSHQQKFIDARTQWLRFGFASGWQTVVHSYNLWQRMAKTADINLTRDLVNLRHLIEILTQQQYLRNGAVQLSTWFKAQISAPQMRSWELERHLDPENGVQLMTIHAAKGLEFKIVFIVAANKSQNKTKDEFFLYQQPNDQAEPSSSSKQSQRYMTMFAEAELEQQNQQRHIAESRRLYYVALTRASHRCYICLDKPSNQSTSANNQNGIDYWLNAKDQLFQFDAVQWQQIQLDQLAKQKLPAQDSTEMTLQAQPLIAKLMRLKNSTSFSALSQQHGKSIHDQFAVLDPFEVNQADDESILIDKPISTEVTIANNPLSWVAMHFPRGAQAGNCLHQILEYIDFQRSDSWQSVLLMQLKIDQLWPVLYSAAVEQVGEQQAKNWLLAALAAWLENILTTPLAADLSLKQIDPALIIKECDFSLGLNEQLYFDQQAIIKLFADYGVQLNSLKSAHAVQWLNGAIDLVFYDGCRYHIADYKSNALGEDLNDFSPEALAVAMTDANYWLQAAIYLVALHRFLQRRLSNYQPEQHLGGAHYLFIRAMTGTEGNGVLHWQPDLALILALDQRLGRKNDQ